MNFFQLALEYAGIDGPGIVIGFIGSIVRALMFPGKTGMTWKEGGLTLLIGTVSAAYIRPVLLIKIDAKQWVNLLSFALAYLSKDLLIILKVQAPLVIKKYTKKYVEDEDSKS